MTRFIIQCAWCRRIKSDPSPDVINIEGIQISHGICPQCKLKHFTEMMGLPGRKLWVSNQSNFAVDPDIKDLRVTSRVSSR